MRLCLSCFWINISYYIIILSFQMINLYETCPKLRERNYCDDEFRSFFFSWKTAIKELYQIEFVYINTSIVHVRETLLIYHIPQMNVYCSSSRMWVGVEKKEYDKHF